MLALAQPPQNIELRVHHVLKILSAMTQWSMNVGMNECR